MRVTVERFPRSVPKAAYIHAHAVGCMDTVTVEGVANIRFDWASSIDDLMSPFDTIVLELTSGGTKRIVGSIEEVEGDLGHVTAVTYDSYSHKVEMKRFHNVVGFNREVSYPTGDEEFPMTNVDITCYSPDEGFLHTGASTADYLCVTYPDGTREQYGTVPGADITAETQGTDGPVDTHTITHRTDLGDSITVGNVENLVPTEFSNTAPVVAKSQDTDQQFTAVTGLKSGGWTVCRQVKDWHTTKTTTYLDVVGVIHRDPGWESSHGEVTIVQLRPDTRDSGRSEQYTAVTAFHSPAAKTTISVRDGHRRITEASIPQS